MMVRPRHFGFNQETAASNAFQTNTVLEDVNTKAKIEFDNMVDVLNSKDIEVKVFDDLDVALPDAVFPNNWISHIPGGSLIIYPMLTPNRRAEVRADIIDWCNKTLQPTSIIDLSQRVEDEMFLEGTGSIVFDHENKVAFACVSPRTNLELLSQLTKKIGYDTVSFESLDLKGQQIYHTNVMMSVGKDIILIYLDSIEDTLERMMVNESLKRSGKTLIELSRPQLNAFAGNALEIANKEGKRFYVMSDTAFESLEDEQIAIIQEKSEILSISIPTFEQVGGGSVRCMMAGFYNYPR